MIPRLIMMKLPTTRSGNDGRGKAGHRAALEPRDHCLRTHANAESQGKHSQDRHDLQWGAGEGHDGRCGKPHQFP